MRTRHRTPSVFSIYMVDVLCCALGCIILLWQVYYNESEVQTAEAKARTEQAEKALSELSRTKLDLNSITGQRDDLQAALDSERKQKVQVTLELQGLKDKLDKEVRLPLVRE